MDTPKALVVVKDNGDVVMNTPGVITITTQKLECAHCNKQFERHELNAFMDCPVCMDKILKFQL